MGTDNASAEVGDLDQMRTANEIPLIDRRSRLPADHASAAARAEGNVLDERQLLFLEDASAFVTSFTELGEHDHAVFVGRVLVAEAGGVGCVHRFLMACGERDVFTGFFNSKVFPPRPRFVVFGHNRYYTTKLYGWGRITPRDASVTPRRFCDSIVA